MVKNPEKALLSLQGVGVNYARRPLLRRSNVPDRWVLNDISFDLYKGESLGVIGRNGIGKSTLLRVMAGIIMPDKGKVKKGRNVKAALLSLRAGFMPDLSGRENVFMSGLLLGMGMSEIRKKYDRIVEFAELQDSMDMPLYAYSDGMKARLGFAICMQMDPDVLLIDEVLGVGDASFKKKSSEEMKQRIRSDQTVVLVSHSPETVRELCTRAVWIAGGTTQAEGDVNTVLEQYEAHLNVGKSAK